MVFLLIFQAWFNVDGNGVRVFFWSKHEQNILSALVGIIVQDRCGKIRDYIGLKFLHIWHDSCSYKHTQNKCLNIRKHTTHIQQTQKIHYNSRHRSEKKYTRLLSIPYDSLGRSLRNQPAAIPYADSAARVARLYVWNKERACDRGILHRDSVYFVLPFEECDLSKDQGW